MGIAGATVEGGLGREAVHELAREAGTETAPPEIVAYYCSRYAALRAGIAELCGGTRTGNDAKERQRFASALDFYRARLAHELSRMNDVLAKSTSIRFGCVPTRS
jgi:hypothetical protein